MCGTARSVGNGVFFLLSPFLFPKRINFSVIFHLSLIHILLRDILDACSSILTRRTLFLRMCVASRDRFQLPARRLVTAAESVTFRSREYFGGLQSRPARCAPLASKYLQVSGRTGAFTPSYRNYLRKRDDIYLVINVTSLVHLYHSLSSGITDEYLHSSNASSVKLSCSLEMRRR